MGLGVSKDLAKINMEMDSSVEHFDEDCFGDLDDILKANQFDDHDISSIFCESVDRDLGASFGKRVQLNETPYNHDIISNQHELFSSFITKGLNDNLDEFTICNVSEASQDLCLSTDILQGQSSTISELMKEDIALEPTKTCQTNVLNLVSAMKGGRERSGFPPKTSSRVTWSPEVYDPPVSSWARMTKGRHRRHPKPARKDYHKQKSSKIKPSRRSSSSESKIPTKSSGYRATDPRYSRTYFSREMVYPDVLSKPNIGQEPECRSSYRMEMVPKAHFPAAEAS